MLHRMLSVLTWPGRKLISWEREGRVAWPLLLVDAGALGLWLFVLNGYFFHRPLDEDDYATMLGVPVLCYAACLQYRLLPGRPWWHWIAKAVLGEALAAAVLHFVFTQVSLDLSGRQVLKFFASHLALLLLSRLAYLVCRRTLPRAPLEGVRLVLLAGAAVFLFSARLVTSAGILSGDAYWYCVMLSDFVKQWRAGVFPVFVGQTEYAFNGTVNPLRFAPFLQHLAGVVDLLSGGTLPFHILLNLTLFVCALGGIFSAYFCAAAILPGRRWMAFALAALYLACPGVLALIYEGDLFMSMTTLPFAPLVAYGLWRTLRDDRTSIAWTVLPLAAVWYCHPPIALWLTFSAIVVHLAIGCRRWRDPQLYAGWGRGLALFLLTGGYTFISVATLGLPRTSSSVDVILANVRNAFPGMVLPLSADAGAPGNYQLGWSLLFLWLLGGIAWLFWRRWAQGLLLLCAGGLVLLLTPLPRFNEALWRAIPQVIRDITYHGPASRFYVTVAAFTVMAFAGTVAGFPQRRRLLVSVAGGLVLALGVAWSYREAETFLMRDRASFADSTASEIFLQPNNIILTRYAFNSFPSVPPYFTHGYIDPYLENRVLADDQRTVLASNVAAVRPTDARQIPLTAVYDGSQVATLSPAFTLEPGVRYAAHFVPSISLAPGSLLAVGEATQRLYFMPDSSMGMIHAVPTDSFGFLPTSRDFFPLWTPLSQPETIHIRYIFNEKPAVPVPVNFAALSLQAYSIDTLPVKVRSWAPYRAETTAPAAGAWLETPRIYLPGYAATVNGRRAPVGKSPSGLVEVGLQPGDNAVVLSYPGTWPLRASYWAAFWTWTVVLVILLRSAIRRWPPPAVA